MDIAVLQRLLFVSLAMVVTNVAQVQAGTCGYAHCWGAVAAGPDGRAARAAGQPTAPGAYERAKLACGAGCNTVEVFSDGCGVIAQDSSGVAWAGFGLSRAVAERRAMADCEASDPRACRVRVWACSR